MEHAALLAELVAIDSVNPELVAGAAGELEIAHWVARWLNRRGIETEFDEPAPGRLSVVGVVRGSGGGASLMLNAHLDTVGVAGMEQPFSPRIEGNRLYGRGAYDMKGGLAAMLIAAERLRVAPPRGDVIVTAVCDEEFASIGTAAVLKRWRADAAVVTEPTGLNLCAAHKGFAWLEVEARGVAAHGSRPDQGEDAIVKMAPVLSRIATLQAQLEAGARHPLLGPGSVHASLIQGGREMSTYPDRCVLAIERRTVPGETLAVVEQEMHSLAGGLAARVTLVREPFETHLDSRIAHVLLRYAPHVYGETPWFDSALIAAAGIPTVVFGPGGGGAHAAVEWSNLDEVAQAADILTAAAREFCDA